MAQLVGKPHLRDELSDCQRQLLLAVVAWLTADYSLVSEPA